MYSDICDQSHKFAWDWALIHQGMRKDLCVRSRTIRNTPGPRTPVRDNRGQGWAPYVVTRGREDNSDLTEKTLNYFRKLEINLLPRID